MIEIPLRNRQGDVVAFALVDDNSRHAKHTWYLRNGYVARHKKRRLVSLHGEVMGWGTVPGWEIDHINGNPLDCRLENLRMVTRAQNAQNKSSNRGSTSKYRGVSWDASRQKWAVCVKLNGKKVFRARFDDEDEAGRIVSEKRLELMPYTNENRAIRLEF